MSAIDYATDSVVNSDIPTRILEDALLNRRERRRSNMGLEYAIYEKIILGRVKKDLDQIGMLEVDIELDQLTSDISARRFERIYKIPPEMIFNRDIVGASIIMMRTTSNFSERQPGTSTQGFTTSPLENKIGGLVRANSVIPNVANTRVEILSNNVVMFRDNPVYTSGLIMRCTLSLDVDFSNLKNAYYHDFAELVIAATKSYIYRELALDLDQAKLDGGRELGRYREFVDEYRDFHSIYTDLLKEKWYKIAVLNDPLQKHTHLRHSGKIIV